MIQYLGRVWMGSSLKTPWTSACWWPQITLTDHTSVLVNKRVQNIVLRCKIKNERWSLFISKGNHSLSELSKSVLWSLMVKKLKLDGSLKTYKAFQNYYQKRCPFHHQFSSVTQLCPILWDPMDCCMLLPYPLPTPGAYSNSCPFRWWFHPIISSSVIPFSSHIQSIPASGSFQMSQFFTSGSQSIAVSASASVL